MTWEAMAHMMAKDAVILRLLMGWTPDPLAEPPAWFGPCSCSPGCPRHAVALMTDAEATVIRDALEDCDLAVEP